MYCMIVWRQRGSRIGLQAKSTAMLGIVSMSTSSTFMRLNERDFVGPFRKYYPCEHK